jgi:trimeric autotransporter adhesin
VIALAKGANPDGIAVNAAGTLAVVAEAGRGKAAIIDLKTFAVITEIATASGPTNVAVGGMQAVVVNEDSDSISILDLGSNSLQKTLAVGRGPKGVAVDATAKLV